MTQLNWSEYQTAIFSAFADKDSGSKRIIAVAGSGKSTTIVEGAKFAPETRILAVVFGKRDQQTLEDKFPATVQTKTFNALGHRALMKYIGHSKVKLNLNKIYKIACDVIKSGEFKPAMDLAKAARNFGLVPDAAGGIFKSEMEDTIDNWEAIAEHFDIDWSPEVYDNAKKILLRSIEKALSGCIDFDDQIYIPALWSCSMDKFPLVIVDEAQDLSPLQHNMIKKSLEPNGRVFAVGDPNQAIYGFRGAHAQSMTELADTFSMTDLPLTVSFRCPKEIVKHAQKYVSHIQPHVDAKEGRIDRLLMNWNLEDLTSGSAILCRNNAPIITLAWMLAKEGRSVTLLGRDIGKNMVTVMKSLTRKGKDDMDIKQFIQKLETWKKKELLNKPKRAGIIADKAASIGFLCRQVQSSFELVSVIEQLFLTDNADIVLSSIHRAKGREWPTVYFLNSWLLPSKYATQPWQVEQENNLVYVAITRSMDKLVYIDSR